MTDSRILRYNADCSAARARFIGKYPIHGEIDLKRTGAEISAAVASRYSEWERETRFGRYMRLVYLVFRKKHGFERVKEGGWRQRR